MSKRFSILLVVLTIVSGLVSVAISGRVFAVKPAIAVGTKQNEILTVKALRVVDKDDILRAMLWINADNIVALDLYSNRGDILASLSCGKQLSWNPSYKSIVEDDEANLSIHSRNLTKEIQTLISADGLTISRENKPGVSSGMDNNGGYVNVYAKGSKGGAIMGVNEYGNGAVGLWDKNRKKLKLK
jgi:hypothetical protein